MDLIIETLELTVLRDTGSHPEAGDGYWPTPLYEAFAHTDAAEHTLSEIRRCGLQHRRDRCRRDEPPASGPRWRPAQFRGNGRANLVHREELPTVYSANTDDGSSRASPAISTATNWEIVHVRQLSPHRWYRTASPPGHTPGLMGALIDRPDQSLLVVGDEAYVEANYAVQPRQINSF